MFVYRDDTSIEASLQCVGSLVVSIWLMNSVVSLMYEDNFLMYVCLQIAISFCYAITAQNYGPDSHWGFVDFFKKYSFEVLCLVGGLQN